MPYKDFNDGLRERNASWQPQPVDEAATAHILEGTIQLAQLTGGDLIARDGRTATLRWPAVPVNHVLHLLLSVFTAGLWLIVWLLVTASSPGTRVAGVYVRHDGYVAAPGHQLPPGGPDEQPPAISF